MGHGSQRNLVIHGTWMRGLAQDLITLAIGVTLLALLAPLRDELMPIGSVDILILPAFVLVLGVFAGRLAVRIGLPRLTGYIILGAVLGPEMPALLREVGVLDPLPAGQEAAGLAAGLIGHDHVYQTLKKVDVLAVGLVALMAGMEIRLSWLKARFNSLLVLVAAQSFLTPALMIVTVLGIGTALPFMAEAEAAGAPLWAVALLVGTIALANSPMVVVSVIKEEGAKGPLSETAMGLSVLKDVVVLLIFTIAIAMAVGGGTVPWWERLTDAGGYALFRIGKSIAIGAVLGLLLRWYSERTNYRLSWALVGLALAVAVFEEALGIKTLFCLLTTGFVCENVGFGRERSERASHQLEVALGRVAMPVFVIFFTVAGLKLDLPALWRSWHWVFVLVAVRAAAVWLATAIPGRLLGCEEAVRKRLWTAMIPQAGVSIVLIGLVSTQFGDTWGSAFGSLLIACVAIHEVIGPILFSRALRQSGEQRTE